VVVVGVKHKTDGQLLRAFVKVNNDSKVTEEELVKYVEGLSCETYLAILIIELVLINFIPQITWLFILLMMGTL
jgi:acyl-CoA synthetase (AMP-forming)/AMP-acid ligase II